MEQPSRGWVRTLEQNFNIIEVQRIDLFKYQYLIYVVSGMLHQLISEFFNS